MVDRPAKFETAVDRDKWRSLMKLQKTLMARKAQKKKIYIYIFEKTTFLKIKNSW